MHPTYSVYYCMDRAQLCWIHACFMMHNSHSKGVCVCVYIAHKMYNLLLQYYQVWVNESGSLTLLDHDSAQLLTGSRPGDNCRGYCFWTRKQGPYMDLSGWVCVTG